MAKRTMKSVQAEIRQNWALAAEMEEYFRLLGEPDNADARGEYDTVEKLKERQDWYHAKRFALWEVLTCTFGVSEDSLREERFDILQKERAFMNLRLRVNRGVAVDESV